MTQFSKILIAHRLAAVVPESVASKYKEAFERWSYRFDEEDAFDDETFELLVRNDSKTWHSIEEVFAKAKLQGKTEKTNGKKVAYLTKHLESAIAKNRTRIIKEADWEGSWDIRVLARVLVNYYFFEYDRDVGFKELPKYVIDEGAEASLNTVITVDKNCKGVSKLPASSSTAEISLNIRDDGYVTVKYDWKKLQKHRAGRLIGKFGKKRYDWEGEKSGYLELVKAAPGVSRFSMMDTSHNMYGDENNFFYIYFSWKVADFSWNEFKVVDSAVVSLIEPELTAKMFNL